MAAALRDTDVPATTGIGNHSSAMLRGYIIDPGHDAQIDWLLFAPDNTVIGRYAQPLEGTPIEPWALGDPALMADLAMATAPEIARLIEGDRAQAVAEPVLALRPVEGAPGDGNVSLTLAMRSALRDSGLTMAEDEVTANLFIDGIVEETPIDDAHDQLRISWVVSNEAGTEIGRITQENPIPRGSLDGTWGEIALLVADGATMGIDELLQSIDMTRVAAIEPAAGPSDAPPRLTEPPEQPLDPPQVAPLAAAVPAAPPPTAALPPEPAAPPSEGGWRVQLASFLDREHADLARVAMLERHAALLGATPLAIEAAPNKAGTFFRVQAGPLSSEAAAVELCRNLQADGQDCFLVAP
jgi:cell division septation protein DedD